MSCCSRRILSNSLFLLIIGCYGLRPCCQDAHDLYEFDWKKESVINGISLVGFGIAALNHQGYSEPSSDALLFLDKNDINAFDRGAVNYNSATADKLSDVFALLPTVSPFMLALNKGCRKKWKSVSGLYLEAVALNASLTFVAKNTFRRKRPFVYRDDISIEQKLSTDATRSFFSGHTSQSAMASFFFLSVFEDMAPDSKLKPYVKGLAMVLPAATGYMRVRAGKHFPTDVIVGYAVGASIGYFIPKLHLKKKNTQRAVQLRVNPLSESLSMTIHLN